MPVTEFELIAKYFATQSVKRDDVILGIGDDCALLDVNPTCESDELVAITMDTLVAGVHFPQTTSPYDIGHKALAVNLSDLAAMGATPKWITLALTIPESNEQWLQEFSQGLFDLARQHDVMLIGGDVTRGPLTITIQAHGGVPKEHALTRSGAKAGDLIVVSGTLADAALGLTLVQEHLPLFETSDENAHYFRQRLNRPQPRIALGLLLRDIATAAIDISDGLAADLQHILDSSQCGASLEIEKLPFSPQALTVNDAVNLQELALTGGDDYELCFTVPKSASHRLPALEKQFAIRLTCIGQIETAPGLRIKRGDVTIDVNKTGYRHF